MKKNVTMVSGAIMAVLSVSAQEETVVSAYFTTDEMPDMSLYY